MYNILAVCGFGVGSSMVLKMTIEKVCKERGIKCKVENTDLSSAKSMSADVMFTSKQLAEELKKGTDAPVYSVMRYMDQEEVGNALDAFLEEN